MEDNKPTCACEGNSFDPSRCNAQRKRNNECKKRYNDFCSALPSFTPLTVSNGQSPTPNQEEAAKHEAKLCLLNALGGHEEHADALRTYLVAIDNMGCGKEHTVFTGKCPVPDSRGGHHIGKTTDETVEIEEEDEIDDSQIKNASMLAMRYFTLGMTSGTFSQTNMRDICKQTGERNIRLGFCDPNTEKECFPHAYSLNVMGKLAQFIGAQLRVINIGGTSLKSMFDNIDDQLFANVVADGVHMSLCVKHRGTSYNTVEEQQMAVYDSLKEMCDALGRPDIHRKMIENHRFAMVVDTNHLAEYRKAKKIIDNGGEPDPDELKINVAFRSAWKKISARSMKWLRKLARQMIQSGNAPTQHELERNIFLARAWYDELAQARVKKMLKSGNEPTLDELRMNETLAAVWEREYAKKCLYADVSDEPEQPLIERNDSKGTSKYMGVQKSRDKWEARIYIKGLGTFYIGKGDTQEEAAQLYAKAKKKYIVDGKPLTLRPEYQKKSAPAKVRSEVDLEEPPKKKTKYQCECCRTIFDNHSECVKHVERCDARKPSAKKLSDPKKKKEEDDEQAAKKKKRKRKSKIPSEPKGEAVNVHFKEMRQSNPTESHQSNQVARRLPSANDVDLNEPAAKKQKIKAHSEKIEEQSDFESWWDDNFESWWDDHCFPSSNDVDLNEPAVVEWAEVSSRQQTTSHGGQQTHCRHKETVVVAPVNSSFVDLPSDDWEEVYQIATKTTDMLAKGEYLFCFSPGSPLGVGIKDKDGKCVVGKKVAQTPLEIDDIIVSVNGIKLIRDRNVHSIEHYGHVSDQNALKTWESIIKNFSNVVKSIVVMRSHQTSS